MRPICTAPSGSASWRSPLYRSSPSHVPSGPQYSSSGSQTSARPPAKPNVLKPIELERDVAGEDHQVGPGELAAVLLLDRPEQPARLVEVGVVGPAVERREALLTGSRAAAAIGDAVSARAVPCHADHQSAVMTEVGRPPFLRFCHQRLQVLDDRIQVEGLEFLGVVEILAHRIGQTGIAVQDLNVQLARPPVAVGRCGFPA